MVIEFWFFSHTWSFSFQMCFSQVSIPALSYPTIHRNPFRPFLFMSNRDVDACCVMKLTLLRTGIVLIAYESPICIVNYKTKERDTERSSKRFLKKSDVCGWFAVLSEAFGVATGSTQENSQGSLELPVLLDEKVHQYRRDKGNND